MLEGNGPALPPAGSVLDEGLLALFGEHGNGNLVTLKRDGRPQMSVVSYAFDAAKRTIQVSVTESRAKSRNLRRDPRASFMVTGPGMEVYVVGEGIAALTPPATDPQDATVEATVILYRAIVGEHPDWDAFRAALVADQRVVLTLPLDHVYGWTGPADQD